LPFGGWIWNAAACEITWSPEMMFTEVAPRAALLATTLA
jgi:hypothetical protein